MEDEYYDRQLAVMQMLSATYAVIAKFLGNLYPPVRISEPGDGFTGAAAIEELQHARRVISDVPNLSPDARGILDDLMLDWMAGVTLGSMDHHSPAVWKLDIAEAAVERVLIQARLLAKELDIAVEKVAGWLWDTDEDENGEQ